jgi:hypothetical protein
MPPRDRATIAIFELRFLMPDGSVKHIHVLAHTMKHESGPFQYAGLGSI